VSNADHHIENDGWVYTFTPLRSAKEQMAHSISRDQAAFFDHFLAVFEEAQESWEKKIKTTPALKYADSYYLYSMVLSVEGMPGYLVMNVDDIPQVFLLTSQEKVEEDPK
jgi:hypothetical protein